MTRQRWIAVAITGVVAVGLAYTLMTRLATILRTPAPTEDEAAPAQPSPPTTTAVPRIKATLYFGAEDGSGLVAVEREIPLAEGKVAQARALVEAQLRATAPAPLVSTIPEGTTLRGLYVSERNQAFVDLDAAIRAKHPGGSLNELFTVYTIVNAITTNLPDVEQVQLLIDGHEVDTLAGHIDLRRPLRKNDALINKAEPINKAEQ
jgi:spore germination protein GerM